MFSASGPAFLRRIFSSNHSYQTSLVRSSNYSSTYSRLHRKYSNYGDEEVCCDQKVARHICKSVEQASCSEAGDRAAQAAAVLATNEHPVLGHTQHTVDYSASHNKPLEPGLYLVGTPIGNLEDISLRALRILQSVSLVLAEDTRHTRKLLQYFEIRADTLSYHQHNERQRQDHVVQRLQRGEPIALVSDAGMPAISDPGAVLVAAAVSAGVRVVPVPGPCAAIAAVAASGLNTDSFYFVGFLPAKSGKRLEKLQQIVMVPATLIFYVPPHGLAAVLSDMVTVFQPNRQAVVARELTKLHEEFYRGSLSDVLEEFGPEGRRTGAVKGELVLLVEGCSISHSTAMLAIETAEKAGCTVQIEGNTIDMDDVLSQCIRQELLAGNSVSSTSKQLAKQFKVPRSKVYRMALELAAN